MIIMVISKCYFSGELIALSKKNNKKIKQNNNNDVTMLLSYKMESTVDSYQRNTTNYTACRKKVHMKKRK